LLSKQDGFSSKYFGRKSGRVAAGGVVTGGVVTGGVVVGGVVVEGLPEFESGTTSVEVQANATQKVQIPKTMFLLNFISLIVRF
jgi:hypothetical protein